MAELVGLRLRMLPRDCGGMHVGLLISKCLDLRPKRCPGLVFECGFARPLFECADILHAVYVYLTRDCNFKPSKHDPAGVKKHSEYWGYDVRVFFRGFLGFYNVTMGSHIIAISADLWLSPVFH